MQKYQHKKTKVIVEAQQYSPGMEEGIIEGIPFIVCTAGGTLAKIPVTVFDMIVKYNKENRIYTSLYPVKLFKKRFMEVK